MLLDQVTGLLNVVNTIISESGNKPEIILDYLTYFEDKKTISSM